MKFLDYVVPAAFRQKASQVTRLIYQMFNGQPAWTPVNYEALAREGYKKNIWTYRCINAIATAAAGVDWLLYQRQGKKLREIEDHELLNLLYKPNEIQSKFEFFEALAGYFFCSGNLYIEKNGPNQGPPKELWALRPDRIKILPDPVNFVKGYEYTVAGQKTTFDAGRVMHMKSFNPLDDYYGMAPIEAAARGIDQDNSANAWNTGLLQNGARPSGAMVTEGTLAEDSYDRLKEQVDGMMRQEKRGRPLLLEGGLKWMEMSMSPRDMDFPTTKKMSRLEICAAFGVPPEIVGDQEHKTYSNYQEARKAFYEDAVIPFLIRVRDLFNSGLVPHFGENLELDINEDNIEAMQETRDAVWKRTESAFDKGILKLNEAREALGYEADENGDVRLIPLGKLAVGKDADAYNGPEPDDDYTDDDDDEEGKKKLKVKALNLETPKQKIAYWKAIDKRREQMAKRMKVLIANRFKAEQKAVVKALETGGKAAALKAITDQRKEWRKTMTTLYLTVIKDFGTRMFNQLKSDAEGMELKAAFENKLTGFDVYRDAVMKFIATTVAQKVVNVEQTTKDQIKKIIDDGIANGDSIETIAESVDTLYLEQIINNRSTVIARTETISSANFGSREAALQTGLDLEKEWIATPGGRTRDAHRAADGQIREINEHYDVDKEKLMFPGDPEGSPENVIQCRCTEGYIAK